MPISVILQIENILISFGQSGCTLSLNGGLKMKKFKFLSFMILFLFGFSSLKPVYINCFDQTNAYFNNLSIRAKDISNFNGGEIDGNLLKQARVVIGLVLDKISDQDIQDKLDIAFKLNKSTEMSNFKEFKNYIPFRILTHIFAQAIILEFNVHGNDNLKSYKSKDSRNNAWRFHEALCMQVFNISDFDEQYQRILNGYKVLVESKVPNVSTVRVDKGLEIGFNLADITQDQALELLRLRKQNKKLKMAMVIGAPIIMDLAYLGSSWLKYNKKIAALGIICQGMQDILPACSESVRFVNPYFVTKILPLEFVALVAILIIFRKNLI